MKQAAMLDCKQTAISHNLELYCYLASRESRKKYDLYKLENFISKNKQLSQYQKDEEEFGNFEKLDKKNKKQIIKLL